MRCTDMSTRCADPIRFSSGAVEDLIAERKRVGLELMRRDEEISYLREANALLSEDIADLRMRLAIAWDAKLRAEERTGVLIDEARREAAVLLLLEREEFGLEVQARDQVIDTLRSTNKLLLGQLQNATTSLHDLQLQLMNRSADSDTPQKKNFFGIF